MKLVYHGLDKRRQVVTAEEARELIPCKNLFYSPNLIEPYTALIPYQNTILPIQGLIPDEAALQNGDYWVLVLHRHGVVVADIPEIFSGAEVEAEEPKAVQKLSPEAA